MFSVTAALRCCLLALAACLLSWPASAASLAPSSGRGALPSLAPWAGAAPLLAAPRLGPGLSSSFLTDLRQGSLALPSFDAVSAAPAPVQVPQFSLSASAPRPHAPASPAELYRSLTAGPPSHIEGLTPSQLSDLWKRTYEHKIAGLDDEAKLKRYDPDGIIGFCFGRAMAAHLLARQLGLPQDRIKKLFVIGDLRSGETPEWRFHVTTLVKGIDDRWHAVDPIMDGPMTADEWISAVHRGWDPAKKARFYLTDADAVIPDITSVPDLPKETAARIIELAFDPEGKEGFTPWSGSAERVYEIDAARQAGHLRSAGSSSAGFDFLQVAVNDMLISYNGYFADLLAELAAPSLAGPRFRRPFQARPQSSPALGLNLGKLKR
ncbi:MAG: hypothetical protein HY924_07250 [Elusimicrobia bacterium]|nr:hypothetical protein [Elusimicrobiota bacterium]